MNIYKSDFFASCIKEIYCFFNCVTNRTHCNDNSFSIRSTVVVERLVVCAEFFIDFVHIHFHSCNSVIVILIASLTMLEENIAVFSRTTKYGMFRIECSFTKSLNIFHIYHRFKFIIIPNFYLLNFVRSTEAVKEMENRNSAFESRKVCNCTQVHNFLYI